MINAPLLVLRRPNFLAERAIARPYSYSDAAFYCPHAEETATPLAFKSDALRRSK